jgi:hypothetical protein
VILGVLTAVVLFALILAIVHTEEGDARGDDRQTFDWAR